MGAGDFSNFGGGDFFRGGLVNLEGWWFLKIEGLVISWGGGW